MKRAYRLSTKIIFLCSCLLISTTCSPRQFDREMESRYDDPFDKDLNLNRGEIREFMRPGKGKDKADKKDADKTKDAKNSEEVASPEFSSLSEGGDSMPQFSPVVLAPDAPDIQGKKRVTLTITEGIELKDVFMEIARLAELELALDPNIKGGVILSVNNRPINEVLDMLADMAELRYTTENGILRVVKDTPYLVNYSVDYLNLTRSSSGSINMQTQVLSSSGGGSSGGSGGGGSGGGGGGGASGGGGGGSSSGGGSGGLNSGSSNSITMSYNGDLWGSVEANLKSILTTKLATEAQLVDTPAATSAGGGATAARPAAETSGDSSLLTQVINQVGSNAAAAVGGGGGAGGSAGAARGAGGGATGSSASGGAGTAGAQISPSIYYSINKQAGIITVMANSKKHASVKEYLDKVRTNMSAQVLIEAKVVEVQLDEQFASGIDWSGFSILQHIGFPATQFAKGNLATASSGNVFKGLDPGLVTLNLGRDPKQDVNQIGAVLKMIQGFGTSRTLQSPRLTVLNNQQAVLSFAKNQTYYTVTGTLQTSSTTATTAGGTVNNTIPITVTSTLHTIPIGVILSMQPSIDVDSQEVTLHVRPTLSVKAGDGLPDPAVTLLASSITSGLKEDQQKIILDTLSDNKVPIIQVREMDTVLKMKSGGVMVIGGLIQHTDTNIEQGMPYTSRIPFFGNLFRSNQTLSNVTETIILIQATILPTNGYYDKHDKKLYEDYTNDPRPLVF